MTWSHFLLYGLCAPGASLEGAAGSGSLRPIQLRGQQSRLPEQQIAAGCCFLWCLPRSQLSLNLQVDFCVKGERPWRYRLSERSAEEGLEAVAGPAGLLFCCVFYYWPCILPSFSCSFSLWCCWFTVYSLFVIVIISTSPYVSTASE